MDATVAERGPRPRAEEVHRRVERLVTDAVPYDEHRDGPEHARRQARRRPAVRS